MKRIAGLGLFTAVLALGQQPPLIIPHLADGSTGEGSRWRTTIVLFNSYSLQVARVSVVFRGGEGTRLAVPLANHGVVSSVEVDMLAQTSVYLETTGASPNAQVGWIEVNQQSGLWPVKGYAIFRQMAPGRPDYEAVAMGTRASRTLTFPFDNTNGVVTSFAVVNLSPSSCGIEVSPAYEESGTSLLGAPKLIAQAAPNGHLAFVSTDRLPELANRRGYLTFASGINCAPGGFAMMGLRFNPYGPFTNLQPLTNPPPPEF